MTGLGILIGIVGAGRAGGSLARALHAAGFTISAVWSRSSERAAHLANDCGAESYPSPAAAARAADLTLLAVIDSQIMPVAQQLASQSGAGRAVVHVSGAQPAAVLATLEAVGWQVGAFHPLQPFANSTSPIALGTAFAIEAAEPLFSTLAAMAAALGGSVVRLASADRALYHAAATIASNYTVTLAAVAAELFAQVGLTQQQALAALLPLLNGTTANLGQFGLPEALTGPLARGDHATVAQHLAALAERAPELVELYQTLGRATLPLVAARGLDSATLAELQTTLAADTLYN